MITGAIADYGITKGKKSGHAMLKKGAIRVPVPYCCPREVVRTIVQELRTVALPASAWRGWSVNSQRRVRGPRSSGDRASVS